MGKLSDKIQPATRLETMHIATYSGIGTVLMWAVMFFVLPWLEIDVPFWKVFLAGLGGCVVAVLNFFLMALTVQKVAATEDEKLARGFMKASFSRRMLLQVLWIVLSLVAPCFYWVAGILPLLFPSAGIKIKGIIDFKKNNLRQEVEQKQDGD